MTSYCDKLRQAAVTSCDAKMRPIYNELAPRLAAEVD